MMMSSVALLVCIILVALVFDFLNGFHDAANSIATIVSTRVLSPVQAVVWAAFFNFVAAFTFGTPVAKTVGKGLIDLAFVDEYVILGGLLGAITWNIITWWFGLPTSSSHALISGYAGAAIAKAGVGVVLFKGWIPVLVFMVISPIIGLCLGFCNMVIVYWLARNAHPRKADRVFRRLQLVSAGLYSLGHGTNDAQKTMGIIVALLYSSGHTDWARGGFALLGRQHEIAIWIILACHAAIGLGTLCGGWRIVKTMGQHLTRLQPVGGFCAETAGAMTIIGAATLGVPVSTTHAITGSILGVGCARNPRSVHWVWGERIVSAWVLTIPLAAVLGAIAYAGVHFLIEPWFGLPRAG
jgi:inorganic phosphate transporter, PiT family